VLGGKCPNSHDTGAKGAKDKAGQANVPALAAVARRPAAIAATPRRLYASEVSSSSGTSEEGSGSSEDESDEQPEANEFVAVYWRSDNPPGF
jgi:hypothetical protein